MTNKHSTDPTSPQVLTTASSLSVDQHVKMPGGTKGGKRGDLSKTENIGGKDRAGLRKRAGISCRGGGRMVRQVWLRTETGGREHRKKGLRKAPGERGTPEEARNVRGAGGGGVS